jgi:outer membrane protein, multidrug efflux system
MPGPPVFVRLVPALLSGLAAFIGGCNTPVLRSEVDVPDSFAAAAPSEAAPEVAWWERFGDPVLTELIQRAASENRDVRIAAERVRAARAGETIKRSTLLPNFGAVVSGIDNDPKGSPTFESGSAAVGVSWEIDLAGGLRAGLSATTYERIATEGGARAVRLLVLTDVASNYFTLVGALRQLETVRAISAAQDETLRLIAARYRVGLASKFDVERARTEASRAQAEIPPLETLVATSRHRIAVLVGDQAANATAAVAPWAGTAVIPDAHPGQPATLLERRPDLLASRALLEAANSRRREAAAEWFPRLFANALFGRQDVELNGIDFGTARFTNASALLTMPIFNWGRTRAINEVADSRQREALLSYEDAIVRALEDVENALVALRDVRHRADALQNAADSAEAALVHAQSLYDRGQIDLLPLLDAQRQRLGARVGANDSSTQVYLASVQLFKALGGGWEEFEPAISEGETS